MQPPLNIKMVGEKVRRLRQGQGFSLEELSTRSDVSRSMLSAVERGEKAPTIVVLGQIATALNTSISRLLDDRPLTIVQRFHEQIVVGEPDTYERRTLSPRIAGVEFEFLRMTIAPSVDAGSYPPHAPGTREFLVVEQGELTLTLDGQEHVLRDGDSIYYDGECAHAYRNDNETPCIFYLVMDIATARR